MGGKPGPAADPYFCSETGRGAEVAAAEQERGFFRGSGGGSLEGGAAWCRRLCPPLSYHPRVPEWDGASRSARLARAVRRHGGGGDGGPGPRGSARRAAGGSRRPADAPCGWPAGTMSAEEEELKVPEEMFKDVKFFTVGDIDPKVPPRPPLGLLPAARVPTPPAGGGQGGIVRLRANAAPRASQRGGVAGGGSAAASSQGLRGERRGNRRSFATRPPWEPAAAARRPRAACERRRGGRRDFL